MFHNKLSKYRKYVSANVIDCVAFWLFFTVALNFEVGMVTFAASMPDMSKINRIELKIELKRVTSCCSPS